MNCLSDVELEGIVGYNGSLRSSAGMAGWRWQLIAISQVGKPVFRRIGTVKYTYQSITGIYYPVNNYYYYFIIAPLNK